MESRISDYHLSSHLENDLSMTCPSEKHCPVDSFCREESNSESVSGGSSDGSVSIIEGLSIEDHTQPMSVDVSTNSSSSDENGCPKCSNDTLLCNRNDDSGYLIEGQSIENHTQPMSIDVSMNASASNEESFPKLPEKFAIDYTLLCNRNGDCGYLNYKTFEEHPNFEKFVDMKSLTLEDLPEIYRHNEMLDLIRAEASVVVKIHMGDNIPGSGLADDVWFHSDKEGVCPCSCDSCVSSPARHWGVIKIVTSSKLTYGATENIPHLTCTFFYDSEDRKDVKQLQGYKLKAFNKHHDLLMFTCITCDMDLVNKIRTNLTTFSDCWETAFDKYYSTVKWEQEKIAFVVSHPYGLRKHLAIGHQLSNTDDEDHRIAFDVPSCPGCIGAYVLLPDFDVDDGDWFKII